MNAAWNEDLAPAERDALIEKLASGIVSRGLATPAILFLEMHKPLSFIASQGLIVTSPLVAPIVGLDRVQTATKVLQDRANVERLICRIEELADVKTPAPEGQRS